MGSRSRTSRNSGAVTQRWLCDEAVCAVAGHDTPRGNRYEPEDESPDLGPGLSGSGTAHPAICVYAVVDGHLPPPTTQVAGMPDTDIRRPPCLLPSFRRPMGVSAATSAPFALLWCTGARMGEPGCSRGEPRHAPHVLPPAGSSPAAVRVISSPYGRGHGRVWRPDFPLVRPISVDRLLAGCTPFVRRTGCGSHARTDPHFRWPRRTAVRIVGKGGRRFGGGSRSARRPGSRSGAWRL